MADDKKIIPDTIGPNKDEAVGGPERKKTDDGIHQFHNVSDSNYPSQELDKMSQNSGNNDIIHDSDKDGNVNTKQTTESEVAYRELLESSSQTRLKTHGYVEEGPFKGQLGGAPGEPLDQVAARQFVSNNKAKFIQNTKVKFLPVLDGDGNEIRASDPNARLPEVDENKRTITIQTPSCSIYFRKKGFRALSDSWGRSPALIKAQKLLLKMKARQVAAMENLSKFQAIYGVDSDGVTKRYDAAANHYRMYFYDDDNTISPPADDDVNGGTLDVSGIVELTNFSSVSTTLDLGTGSMGSFSVNLEDPYNLMYVTEYDVNLVVDMMDSDSEQEDKLDEKDKKYLYDFLAGRSIISAMDTVFIWMGIKGEKVAMNELNEDTSGRFGATSNVFSENDRRFYGDRIKEKEKEIKLKEREISAVRNTGGPISEEDRLSGVAETDSALGDKSVEQLEVEKQVLENEKLELERMQSSDRRISSGVKSYLEGNDSRIDSVDLFNDPLVRQTDVDRQVFEGVVTSVTESYSEGNHVVSIGGTNVLRWLEINQLIKTPSLVEPYGALDNPIDLDEKWKQGLWSVAGKLRSEIFTDVPGQTLSPSEWEAKHGIPNNKYPLNKFDSGSLISKVVTGIETPPSLLAALGDPQNVFLREIDSSKLHTSPQESTFWQRFTHQAQNQNRANGWFVPFGLMPPDIASQTYYSFNSENPAFLERKVENAKRFLESLEKTAQDADAFGGDEQSGIQRQIDVAKNDVNALEQALARAKENNPDPEPTEPIQADILALLQKYADRGTDNPATIDSINNLSADSLSNDQAVTQTVKKVAMWLNDRQENILEPSRADVVFNLDTNFLVIDMTYLQNPDLRVYNINVPNVSNMWQTDTQTPLSICKYAAESIEWEFFADEAGNIRFRLPQYNSVPLKVYNDYILPLVNNYNRTVTDEQIAAGFSEEDELSGVAPPEVSSLESRPFKGALPLDRRTLSKWAFVERNEDIKRRIVKNHARLYITDDQLQSWSFSENEPEFTRVNVSGEWKFEQNIESYPIYITAGAVDFDMWFHYGYRAANFEKKFIRDGASQARPYAHKLLARQRRNILRGQVVVNGNPGYRLGDVVFIESRGLLYYVSGISHSFTWGSDYSTTLQLTYGHAPGIWIPHPWDIVSGGMWKDVASGEQIYNSEGTLAKTVDGSEKLDVTASNPLIAGPPELDGGFDRLPSTIGSDVDIEDAVDGESVGNIPVDEL